MSAKRIGIVFGLIALVVLLLIVRLAQLQLVTDAPESVEERLDEARTLELPAARGAIFDRDRISLRASRDTFGVDVFAGVFRETNLADALADVWMLLSPAPTAAGRAALLARLRDGDERAIESVLDLSTDSVAGAALPATVLDPRIVTLCEPEGTLIRPRNTGWMRLVDAVAVIGGGDLRLRPRDLRLRLRQRGEHIGSLAPVTAADVAARIRDEEHRLAQLGAELGTGDAKAVRTAIDQLCDRHFRRVEEEIERRLDDAICLQHFGSWKLDPSFVGDAAYAEMLRDAGVKFTNDERARDALDASAALLGGSVPNLRRRVPDTTPEAGRIAESWNLVEWDAARVRAAVCRRFKGEGFQRARYLDERKENQARNDLSAFRGDLLGLGGSFALADMIDGAGGLRRLGFRLRPDFGRDPDRAAAGKSLELLLGAVSEHGVPIGSGVELRLDDVLRGDPGEAQATSAGQVTVVRPAQHGNDVQLTLSYGLQKKLEGLLRQPGAIAVVDVATGGILAATTSPLPADTLEAALAELADVEARRSELRAAADPANKPVEAELAALKSRIESTPAIHRAVLTTGYVPPGSVMKAVTLLTGLERGVIRPDTKVDCRNPSTHHPYGCESHGILDVEGALEESCNEYCYEVALKLGPQPLFDMYERLGLFDPVPGIIPASEGEHLRRQLYEKTEAVQGYAIGQGSLSFVPVRLAGLAASIASGRVMHPHLWKPAGFEPIGPAFASADNLAVIRNGMRRVVTGRHGTAHRYSKVLEPLRISGKTGTASMDTGSSINAAWFVGFAPDVNPRYAFAVLHDRVAEHGAVASPTAAKVVDAC